MSSRFDLKTGYPSAAIAPLPRLSEIAAEVIASGRGFQYGGDLQGHSKARELIASFLTDAFHAPAEADQLMLTTGALTAIDIVCRTLTQPGDIVIVEDPTFFFAVDLLGMSHCTVMGVPMREDGLDLVKLRMVIETHPGKVRLVYTIPSFHNPTGYTTSAENRVALIKMAHEHDFYILEDATYQPLYFAEPPPLALKAFDHDGGRVITVESLSKLLMPSLRFGWVWAQPDQIRQFLRFKSDAASSRLAAEIVVQFMTEQSFAEQASYVRHVYRRKHDALVMALTENAPSWLNWRAPNGGFFLWATLPEGITAANVLDKGRAHGLDVFPGRDCYVTPPGDQAIRLCFALLDEDVLADAGRVFCEVVRAVGAEKGLGE